MASSELEDLYFTYEGRRVSFLKSTKKRGSAANNRGTKQLAWPHKSISPASLASAGFFFSPSPDNPDNTVCFLCRNGLDGWENGDDPLAEHLKHAPDCGWAIVAAIEAELGDYFQQDPSLPEMIEARRATFAGRWPHEGKKGWKCKTKQLVDAGWKYTPTSESEDMATCTYCQLALDGWERNDKPLDEHYKRSPDCSFFAMINQSEPNTKKGGRGKTARASKASRLSVQSVATVASETTSVNEMTAGPEDSVLTTTSTMAQGGKKTKAKKATTSRAKKGKAKKEEPAEVAEADQHVEELPVSPLPKTTRGKKRTSDAVEESILHPTEVPASKKRATRTRGNAPEASVIESEDVDMSDAPAPKESAPRKKSQAANTTRSNRQVSTTSDTSTAPMTSPRGPPGTFPDDDEIERQLQADLDRQMSDDEEENFVVHDDSFRSRAETMESDVPTRKSADYAMFDPAPVQTDEADVDDELKALQVEMEAEEPEQLQVPKKGRKAGVRKASQQTKAKTAKASLRPPKEEDSIHDIDQQPAEHAENAHDVSIGSTDTVLKKTDQARPSTGKRGRGRPSKASLASQEVDELAEPVKSTEPAAAPVKRGRGRPSKASLASRASGEFEEHKPSEAPVKRGRGRPPKHSLEMRASLGQTNDRTAKTPGLQIAGTEAEEDALKDEPEPRIVLETAPSPTIRDEAMSPPPPPSSSQSLAQPPLTPAKIISPAPSARQPALSPSQSPQSSDAENQPPSSKPTASATTKRVVLAPVATSPVRDSPSRRNILAGLQSSVPWTAVDLEAVLGTPRNTDKENGAERFLKQGKELTSPEKRMTVEEWIYYNAAQAEKQLKHECELMISRFENEGTRAMNVLESLRAD